MSSFFESQNMPMIFAGFDPGGENAFGWAVLTLNNCQLKLDSSGTCSYALSALEALSNALRGRKPKAIGIDAPLHWVASGDREADKIVRGLVREAKGMPSTVNHVNSLRGACIVQGVLIAHLTQLRWEKEKTLVTEAHPKALLQVSSSARKWANRLKLQNKPEHERDAALAAYCAHAFAFTKKSRNWRNLVSPNEQELFFPSGKEAAYFFPAGID